MRVTITYTIFFIFLSLVSSMEEDVSKILNKAMENYNNKNCNFELFIIKKQKFKPEKKKKYNVNIFYPHDDSIKRMIRIDTLEPKNLSKVSYWEHLSNYDSSLTRWISMPVTEKIKKLAPKEKLISDIDFNDIILNPNEILSNANSVIDKRKLNQDEIYIIESIGLTKQHYWISAKHYNLVKIEIFNKYNRVLKEVNFTNLVVIDDIYIPQFIIIKDLRKKITYDITIKDFLFDDITDKMIFYPKY